MRLLFQNSPYKDGQAWIYGRWERDPRQPDKPPTYYMHASLDGTIEDLEELLMMEEKKNET